MAKSSEVEEGKSGKGFSGLSSMVSDVDDTVERAAKERESASGHSESTSQKASKAGQHTTPDATPQPYQQQSQTPQSSEGSSAGKWLFGVGAVIGVIWLFSSSGSKTSVPPPTYTSSAPAASVVPPSPPASVATPPAPSARVERAQPTRPTRPVEEMPPVGTNNALNVAQIRYCLAEDIRLEAAKQAVNGYVTSEVDLFNSLVTDYNNRCGQFRYRKGSLESARTDIEAVRSVLEAEGRNRFRKSRSEGSGVTSTEVTRALPDEAGKHTKSTTARRPEPTSKATKEQGATDGLQRLASLSAEERNSIEMACNGDKVVRGPAAYNACLANQLARLK